MSGLFFLCGFVADTNPERFGNGLARSSPYFLIVTSPRLARREGACPGSLITHSKTIADLLLLHEKAAPEKMPLRRDLDASAGGLGPWALVGLRRAAPLTRIYWTALLFIDPLTALPLLWRPTAGPILSVAVIVSDVVHNSWLALHHPIRMDL
ncbi:hypothetical protein PQR53_29285 [Paraburkholderia fungorum]|uniref:hypothetical protein n=1 Tax=Paraburkholderia fungorum TaxID=134537 RepID=UPI0038BBBEDF